ncbi:hypothetical protein L2E69_15140 [Planktothrix agardhii 1806]|jgi:hypothetical protein|uniref:hypothetical protein n=2 Tax=Planktothrix agardhii TaxID=1160 RepID=UPI001F37D470|nr:hypothetical protein [Planktothrix agardhii]MCF3609544.1 hypothetical protein [Planktothrix agardhii 1033]MCF3569183.1 hypothetical protein [Planktothrix agardhii 1807]MCF3571969.1 hypothetical protein [Planktothrix agardhii 1805]MCF3585138.1 hypothetical protein [Planktothrix agardhii 1803]MCF3601819.1 hypothetical protein [Planktothrix agardhii 1804]
MLINIHKSVFDNKNIWNESETIPALENLANAVREGKHLVISDRKTLGIIANCQDLSKTTQAIYNMLYNKFSELRSYLSVVTRYIEITDILEPRLISLSGKEVIQVPLGFFENTESIQKTILLCENSRDTFFYQTVARVYVIWQKINIKIECESRGGGGNTINIEYDNIQQKTKRLCLCILDSDRISPEGKLGSTAALIASIDQNQNSQFFRTKVFILDVHEIENLIPDSILIEICSKNKEREDAMKRIKTLQEISGYQIKHFLDIKQGTLMYKIFNSTNPKDQSFWENRILEINTILKCINNDCLADWKCKIKNPKNHCQCQISLGFGEHTLDNTIEYLEKIEPHKIAREFNNDMKPEWEKIGQVVVDFCIAHSPIRA